MNINDALMPHVAQRAESSNSSSANAANSSERDLFMTLLVAQLKNQDPLEPQDGSQFVAQLAQFNSLDQLISIRQLLEQLTGGTGTQQSASKNSLSAGESIINESGSILQQGESVLKQGNTLLNKGESVINSLLKVI